MTNMFDAAEGARRLFDALERVGDNADPDWKEHAETAVRFCAKNLDEFTADDVWGLLQGVEAPHEPRAMGAVMRHMASQGVIQRTDRVRESVRAEAHRSPKRIWKAT